MFIVDDLLDTFSDPRNFVSVILGYPPSPPRSLYREVKHS